MIQEAHSHILRKYGRSVKSSGNLNPEKFDIVIGSFSPYARYCNVTMARQTRGVLGVPEKSV